MPCLIKGESVLKRVRTYNINKVSLKIGTEVRFVNSKSDEIAIEEPLEVWVKHIDPVAIENAEQYLSVHLITTMRTPGNDIELVKGWMLATFAFSSTEILSITTTGTSRLKGIAGNQIVVTLKPEVEFNYSDRLRIDYANSSCGVCGQQSIEHMMEKLAIVADYQRILLTAKTVSQLPAQLSENQTAFKLTGGIHAAALVNEDGEIEDLYEDVGRHNAVDKLIGSNLHRLPGRYALLLSGRISFELVQKAAVAGISMIVAVGAPTSLAVECCIDCDICLIGFVKNATFNIYNRPNQVLGIQEQA